MSGVLEQDGGEQGGKGATAYNMVNVCLASLSPQLPMNVTARDSKDTPTRAKRTKVPAGGEVSAAADVQQQRVRSR